MRHRPLIIASLLSLGLLVIALLGAALRHSTDSALSTLSGVWNGTAILQTKTGAIEYEMSALVQPDALMLSMVAQTDNNAKFAFKLNLGYLEHTDNTFLFSVDERSTVWLEELRDNEELDIPVAGHLLQITLLEVTSEQIFFLFDLGQDYPFASMFTKGI